MFLKPAAFLLLIFLQVNFLYASTPQKRLNTDSLLIKKRTYKKIDTVDLKLHLYYPQGYKKNKQYPAIIFFFGGGWNSGSINQFEQHARYFSSRGMISILADYRVFSRNKTSPFEAVKDARSALRYIKIHSKNLNIDSTKIVASGGSAGGHLAAACDLLNVDEAGDDLAISTKPVALVLFNPVFDNGPGGYGYERIGEGYPEISPIHNIKIGAAPTILFFGTKDKFVPIETAKLYKSKIEAVGTKCDLFLFEGQGHGFFNYHKIGKNTYFLETLKEADHFLYSLGLIKGKPTLHQYVFN
ncbi:acetyl esterase [Pedobacter sp. CG_S7]|uniref:alpha/beta hydrolase n=1 Tax=Pedobacter sp. CG_S7 TaxID=3143930 RepID=UPI003397D2FD